MRIIEVSPTVVGLHQLLHPCHGERFWSIGGILVGEIFPGLFQGEEGWIPGQEVPRLLVNQVVLALLHPTLSDPYSWTVFFVISVHLVAYLWGNTDLYFRENCKL